mmetsp:Transcript_15298/g.23037  ORF Transcript_15298/g.23037 Transcript_15298/m.23037 type:complete len:285 (-) Transcript_15298:251-1105(-)
MPRPKYLTDRKVNTKLLYKTLVSISDLLQTDADPTFESDFLERLYEESVYPHPDVIELKEWLLSRGGRKISDREVLNLLAYVNLYTPVKFISREYTVSVVIESCSLKPPPLSQRDSWCYQIKTHAMARKAALKFAAITGIRRSSLPRLNSSVSAKNLLNRMESKIELDKPDIKPTLLKLPSISKPSLLKLPSLSRAQSQLGNLINVIRRRSSSQIAPMINQYEPDDFIQDKIVEEKSKEEQKSASSMSIPIRNVTVFPSDDDERLQQDTDSDDMNGTEAADLDH